MTDEKPLDPAALLATVQAQQARVGAAFDVDPRLVYGVWGVAQLVGFGLIGASWRVDREPLLPIPPAAAVLAYVGCIVAAVVVTVVHTTRATRGLRGQSAVQGAMYGWAWFLGFLCMSFVIGGLVNAGLSYVAYMLLWPALTGMVVGLMYLAGGALWRDRVQYGLGAWVLVTSTVGTLAGVPGNYAVMALAGGGGFLAAAAWFTVVRTQRHEAVAA